MIKISVIIPVYNSQNFIFETLESLSNQIYDKWECIIIDDGSTDNSKDKINIFLNDDSRFKYFYQENAGPSKARNYGMKIANGDIIHFLDSDDIIDPNLFNTIINKKKIVNRNELLYCNMLIGKQDNILETYLPIRKANLDKNITLFDLYFNFGKKITFIPSCIFFTKDSLENIYWDTNLKHSEDWDFYLKVLERGYIFKNINKYYVTYRDTKDSLSKNISSTLQSNYYILNKWKKINYYIYLNRMAELYLKSIKFFIKV